MKPTRVIRAFVAIAIAIPLLAALAVMVMLRPHDAVIDAVSDANASTIAVQGAAVAATVATNAVAQTGTPNVVVLGVDGMDPDLLQKFIDAGRMPNFAKLAANGSFSSLETSMPPQSPVAWSNFITGMDPGGHGIFDFIHRDPQTYLPEFSTALVSSPDKTIKLGSWVIPVSQGRVELLRKGDAFWQILDTKDVPYLIFRIPANFPPVESKGTSVSGMGTPDLLGSYGTFSFYTDDLMYSELDVSGGEIFPVTVKDNRVEAALKGPQNSLREGNPSLTRPFVVDIDDESRAARITVDDDVLILNEREWSDWVEVKFDVLGKLKRVSGICKFYLRSLDPHFQLYVTPININPANPALPISNDPGFTKAMHDQIGFHYTQGMPEDTKALEWGVFSDAEFVKQSEMVFQERLKMLDTVLDDYTEGLLFFYFSSIDQTCHMLWKNMDPNHPAHDPEDARFGSRIEDLYARMDSVLGVVQSRVPKNSTIVVMSDHGFAPFYKKFNLNTWLLQNDFMTLRRPEEVGEHPLLQNVFWRRTQAYALGINGLYINLRGREGQGLVPRGEEYDQVIANITEKLLATRDPETGEPVIARVYTADEIYQGSERKGAPDLVVGYHRGYRCGDDSALGTLSSTVITPNLDAWSGSHCMAHEEVPGVLLSNRPLMIDDPTLIDLTASILRFYDTSGASVKGRALFGDAQVGSR